VEDSKDINNRLDELFAKARTAKPVMGADEVRNLIAAAPVTASSQSGATKSTKGNTGLYMLLIGLTLVIASGFAWYFMKSDNDNVLPQTNGSVNSSTAAPSTNESQGNEQTNNNSNPTNGNNSTVSSETNDATAMNDANASPAKENVTSKEPVAKTESVNAKAKTPEVEKAEPSKNKTIIVTGGDMKLKFHADDKEIEMSVKDNVVGVMSVNGKTVSTSDYGKYKDIIEQGLKMAADEQAKNPTAPVSSKTPEEQKRDDINTKLFAAFTDQLKKDKLVDEEKYSFKLTSSEMLINGKAQPDAIRQKYLDLFKSTAGRDLGGTTFKFDHGLN